MHRERVTEQSDPVDDNVALDFLRFDLVGRSVDFRCVGGGDLSRPGACRFLKWPVLDFSAERPNVLKVWNLFRVSFCDETCVDASFVRERTVVEGCRGHYS